MANIFLESITYVTEAELKESTRIKDPELAGTGQNDIENRTILIRKAEIIIDSIIGTFGTKASALQETIFPTLENGVPTAIKKATVLLCEGMYLGGEIYQSNQYSGSKIAKAEWFGDHKVEFQDEEVHINSLGKKNQYVTPEIEMLLKPYLSTSTKVKWSKSV